MKGGILDDSGLPESDRKLIVRVYDERVSNFDDNITIYGNPGAASIHYSIIVDGNYQDLQVELYDISGKLLVRKTEAVAQGINYFTVKTEGLSAGMYFLNIQEGSNFSSRKVILR